MKRRDQGGHGASKDFLTNLSFWEGEDYFTSQVSPARSSLFRSPRPLGDNVPDLLVHHVFVAWYVTPCTETPMGVGSPGGAPCARVGKRTRGLGWWAS